ncbi:Beta-barrel assembly machine subunit BamE [Nitrosospira sp. Nl5]|uniref:outer membrane protein assembly factor BamE domain-containing protein n=1 Tax=Nitrosospira sp. Nl5 TaxID=200120 RepID=UPI00088E66CB|nr:outer membrane protein assembly factor BamE [Nitrosospira sp. Nl5]SCX88230.1 Beta-barrel assembly machine subunit BamE [Nitrosospira sp. Nl5]
MKIVKSFAGTVLVALVAGCATLGNEKLKDHTQSTISQQITEGKTTKNQVIAALGQPSVVSFTDAGNEIWTYKHARAIPQAQNFIPLVGLVSSGADVKTKELVVMFNKHDVVSKYTMRETEEVVKSGIAH